MTGITGCELFSPEQQVPSQTGQPPAVVKPAPMATQVATDPTARPAPTYVAPTAVVPTRVPVVPTAQPAQPMVTSGNTSPFPTLFNEQSTGKGTAFAYDIGVNSGQHGIVFGQFIQWGGQKSGDITKGCGLVVLEPGFYRALYIVDGRYEIRDLPMGNEDFWRQKLAEDRAKEQVENYGCADRKASDIPVWKSQNLSPPASVSQAPPPTKSSAPPAPAATPAVGTKDRLATGVGRSMPFRSGDAVIGFKIVLDNGKSCEGGCYLPSAPSSGTVTDGVINPWPTEVSNTKTWNP